MWVYFKQIKRTTQMNLKQVTLSRRNNMQYIEIGEFTSHSP